MRRALIVAGIVALGAPASSVGAAPPPGATARCRDGTYSLSQHRSGTCSHHGGVATWLTGGTGSTAPVAVGATVLLAARTKTSGCAPGPNPDRRCSPGAYYSRLTTAVICSSAFRTSTIRNVPESEREAVELEYGIAPARYGTALEVDHIVPLELGGSNDIANLFPERASADPGYHVKDRLENTLHSLVCAGRLGLRAAQRQIAANWQALYARVFGTAPAA